MGVQPFKVQIPQATLENLRERLAHTRFPDEISDADWDYGANLAYIKELGVIATAMWRVVSPKTNC